MKYFLNLMGIATLGILLALSSCNNSSNTTTEESTTENTITQSDTQVIPLTPAIDTNKNRKQDTVLIKTSMGNITVVLYNETPLHRDNFLKLIRENYYNGIFFHRIMKNFMIQTGDPNSRDNDPNNDGAGGPGYTIPAEFNPNLLHKKGALAAARTGDHMNPEKASSGSQFYICHVATPMLDGQYTVFGEAIEGFDVIDKIAESPTIPGPSGDGSGPPVKPIKIISMSIVKAKPAKASKKATKVEKEIVPLLEKGR